MKKLSVLSLLVVILITSCQTSSELGSNALIQKRRYTKGYNLNLKKSSTPKYADKSTAADEAVFAEAEGLSSERFIGVDKSADLKTEERKNMQQASAELSQALLQKPAKDKRSEIESISPTSAEEAYPLNLNNRRYQTKYQRSAGADVNFNEVNVWTIIITILLPPLGVALILGVGTEFWISLVLTLLFYFPGLIYSLIMIL